MSDYVEERMIYGDEVDTPDRHNQSRVSNRLILQAPDRWAFVKGNADIEVTRDSDGSAQWNMPNGKLDFKIITDNPDMIEAELTTGARSIGVRLVCLARLYP